MHEQGANPGVVGDSHCPEHGVLQQCGSHLLPLRTPGNGEPAQHQDRDGVWHGAANGTGRALVSYGSCCQDVVADNEAALIKDDKCAAGSAKLIGECTTLEPVVEAGLAAFEGPQVVQSGKRLGSGQAHA